MSTNASPPRIYVLNGVALLGLLALTIAASYLSKFGGAQSDCRNGHLDYQHRADSFILHACPPHQATAVVFRRRRFLLAGFYVRSRIQRFPDQGMEIRTPGVWGPR